MRVLEFDRVDQIDAEIAVHGFVAKNVHVLFRGARHFVLTAQCQNLRKTNIKEQAFHQACENDQGFKQCLIVFRRAGLEVLIGNRVDERDQKFIFGAYRRNLVVGVEDFRFIQIQAFDDVLIGVCVDGFLERLAQQELSALGRGDVPVCAKNDVVGGQRVGGDGKTDRKSVREGKDVTVRVKR